jgi:hypothetical protein
MPSCYMRIRLVALLAFILASDSFAQSELKLEHDSSWEIVGKDCTIRAAQFANLRAEETGPLFLSLYAKPGTGYDGNSSPGRLVARAPIGVLAANATLNNIIVTTKARGVPRREQFTALVVEELSGKKTYTILDYVVYTSTYTFPAKQSGGVGSEDSGVGIGNVAFEGAAAIGGAGRFADFNLDKIQNHRETLTGLLRLGLRDGRASRRRWRCNDYRHQTVGPSGPGRLLQSPARTFDSQAPRTWHILHLARS